MKKISDDDLEVLTVDLLNCYLSDSYSTVPMKPQEKFTQNEIELIKKHMFDVVDNQTLSLSKVSIYSSNEIYDLMENLCHLLNQIFHLKELLNKTDCSCKDRERTKGYREILKNLIEMDGISIRLSNKSLKRRIQGIINVQKRYEGNLYKKREIIYRVLREEVIKKGPWKTVTAAVNDVYPVLMQEFEIFDRQWITSRINENFCKIEKLKFALADNNKTYDDMVIRTQDRTYINQIQALEHENDKFIKALNTYNVADVLHKKLAFNSNDQEQTIINHVRNCPDLLIEIINKEIG